MARQTLVPLVTGCTCTLTMPGTPCCSRIFQAMAARWMEDIMLFSLYEPGRVPSCVPRRMGSLRWGGHATVVPGVLAEGTLQLERFRIGVDESLDDNLRAGGNHQVVGLAAHQF